MTYIPVLPQAPLPPEFVSSRSAGLRGPDLCEDEGWYAARAGLAVAGEIAGLIGSAFGGNGAQIGAGIRGAVNAATGTWGAICDEIGRRRDGGIQRRGSSGGSGSGGSGGASNDGGYNRPPQPPPQPPPQQSQQDGTPEWVLPAALVGGAAVLVLLLRR